MVMKFTKDAVEKLMDCVDLGFVYKEEDDETYMTAKLNEEALKLEPSDFMDCVVLSVDEATKLRDLLLRLQRTKSVSGSVGMESYEWTVFWTLNGRISSATTEPK